MIICIPGRRNAIAYLFWRWALAKNGGFVAWLDGFFFGASRGLNNYDLLAVTYKKSNIKPDKQYSMLPTVLKLVGDCEDRVVLDVGCGDGFFTVPLAGLNARRVYGIDNSQAQLALAAKVSRHPRIEYILKDVFVDNLPSADVIVIPFVTNYARTTPILRQLFRQLYTSLSEGGKVILLVDLPNDTNLKRFGAMKYVPGGSVDEGVLRITLYNEEEEICTLSAVYYTADTIEKQLREVGFPEVQWHRPIVSEEGLSLFGEEFWKDYINNPELGYLTARK
ncbi:MAG: methyltransferase [Candidatus Nomurabacteria bacterium]|nr:methyltransferase [Candidatus Nomurabacteria bacterium]